MIKDLKMAKRIQQQFIPSRCPVDYVASFYKPMELVSGDFYDFVRFRDPNLIGIFLSDVSGHGVPAAFITSMIKSVILEGSSRREDPAGLLSFINDILQGQTADNFVTAFYCVYNSATRELLYANAGHPLPYIIQESGITTLGDRRHPPLAVFSREMLSRKGKKLENTSVTLAPGSRLFLYTDGITEAQNDRLPSGFYETEGLEQALMKYRSLPCRDFLQSVYGSLIEYRGSDNFDDDVCFICIDIPDIVG
jgi:sigma-B regulation protein RsbU (phosphoserine phosphatase)